MGTFTHQTWLLLKKNLTIYKRSRAWIKEIIFPIIVAVLIILNRKNFRRREKEKKNEKNLLLSLNNIFLLFF